MVFLVELIVRVSILRKEYFRSLWNWFDAAGSLLIFIFALRWSLFL